MFACYQSMTATLGLCGIAPLVRGQDRTAPGPVPRRSPPYATDCDSDFLAMETHLNSSFRFHIRGYELYINDRKDRPKEGVAILIRNKIPFVEISRSQDSDTEYVGVRLILGGKDLYVYTVYSPPNKQIDLQDIKPTPESWTICGDFNSHSPAWDYKKVDAKGEDVEDWIASNKLILINTPYDEPTSRSWNTISTPDLAAATDDIQKVTQLEACSQLGGSDHRPVILNVNRDIKLNPHRLPPTWNYKKAYWENFQEIADGLIKNLFSRHYNIDSNISTFTKSIIQAAKLFIPRSRRKDYKP
ncbi:hypothetical protein RRG08_014414 [Elysia crispata]|uniref:Endonuclease/exonuclease/phosphatase domain-containing protein n=1 Tax=Elysia crispata TaxID=231223 RepID=A0AAE1D645_9GAST|nr:hypothetical protein RRG08_014414 [Elysia crispata]